MESPRKPIRSQSTSDIDDAKQLFDDIHDYLDILTNILKNVAEEEGELPPSAAKFMNEYETYVTNTVSQQPVVPPQSPQVKNEWRRSLPLDDKRSRSEPAVFQMSDASRLVSFAPEPAPIKIERVKVSATFSKVTEDIPLEEGVSDSPIVRKLNETLYGTAKLQEIIIQKQITQTTGLLGLFSSMNFGINDSKINSKSKGKSPQIEATSTLQPKRIDAGAFLSSWFAANKENAAVTPKLLTNTVLDTNITEEPEIINDSPPESSASVSPLNNLTTWFFANKSEPQLSTLINEDSIIIQNEEKETEVQVPEIIENELNHENDLNDEIVVSENDATNTEICESDVKESEIKEKLEVKPTLVTSILISKPIQSVAKPQPAKAERLEGFAPHDLPNQPIKKKLLTKKVTTIPGKVGNTEIHRTRRLNNIKLVTFPTPNFNEKFDFLSNIVSGLTH
ncbi:hypothetical protein G9A89_021125 [Geosiphon pyriformis]|nr:hypothetical protein G9A89_021125 [Geosiphon pyriformis]